MKSKIKLATDHSVQLNWCWWQATSENVATSLYVVNEIIIFCRLCGPELCFQISWKIIVNTSQPRRSQPLFKLIPFKSSLLFWITKPLFDTLCYQSCQTSFILDGWKSKEFIPFLLSYNAIFQPSEMKFV